MKSRRKRWIILAAAAVAVVATVIANHRLNQRLEAAYGEGEIVCYGMGETVPFGDDRVDYLDDTNLNGYSVRVDKAEVLTCEELLERCGYTEDSEALADIPASLPEKVCFITMTVANEGSDAPGFYLADITCEGLSFMLSLDTSLTTLCNDFFMDAFGDDLAGNSMNMLGVTLDAGEEAEIYLVYDYYEGYFNRCHWNHLEDVSLHLQLTRYPTQKMITLEFE